MEGYYYIEAIPATPPVVETSLFYEDESVLVAFSDIQHVEKLKRGPYPPRTTEPEPNGLHVITSKTHYDMQADAWSNPVYISEDNSERFLSEYKAALIAAARKGGASE